MFNLKIPKTQSTRIQRKQWENLMKFNKSPLGKGDVSSPNNKITELPYCDKIHKSNPIKA